MQIVIDIPKGTYDLIKHNVQATSAYQSAYYAIRRGTVLPAGHGRLIDADKLASCTRYYAPRGFEGLLMRYAELQDAPTIIEADKEVNE